MTGNCAQVGTASLTGMMLEDSAGGGDEDPLEWVQRQEIDELKVRAQQCRIPQAVPRHVNTARGPETQGRPAPGGTS